MQESLSLRLREELSINCETIQSLSTEMSSTRSKNIAYDTIYRPTNRDIKQCQTRFKDLFPKKRKILKNIILAECFYIKFLNFETDKKVQDFLNLMFIIIWFFDKNDKTGNQTLSQCHRPQYHQQCNKSQ